MEYQIKQLSLEYINEIVSMISNALKKDFPYKQETILVYCKDIFNKKHFSKFLRDKKNAIFGAFLKNTLVGIVALKADFGGVLFIDWLIVKEGYRQKGIGSFLLEEAEKWALENKYHYIYLMTETDKNIAYYKKRGFRYVGKHINSWFGEIEHELGKSLRNKPFQEVFKV